MDPPGQAEMPAAPVTYAAFAGTCFSPAPTADQAAHLAQRLEDRRSLQQPASQEGCFSDGGVFSCIQTSSIPRGQQTVNDIRNSRLMENNILSASQHADILRSNATESFMIRYGRAPNADELQALIPRPRLNVEPFTAGTNWLNSTLSNVHNHQVPMAAWHELGFHANQEPAHRFGQLLGTPTATSAPSSHPAPLLGDSTVANTVIKVKDQVKVMNKTSHSGLRVKYVLTVTAVHDTTIDAIHLPKQHKHGPGFTGTPYSGINITDVALT